MPSNQMAVIEVKREGKVNAFVLGTGGAVKKLMLFDTGAITGLLARAGENSRGVVGLLIEYVEWE